MNAMTTEPSAAKPVAPTRRRIRVNASLVVGIVLTAGFLIVAIVSFFYLPFNPNIPVIKERLLPPGSGAHLLGTDVLGRDIVAQLMVGARTSIIVGAGGATISLLLGLITGLAAAAYGKITDEAISRLADIMLSIPGMVTALVLAASMGSGALTTIFALTASRSVSCGCSRSRRSVRVTRCLSASSCGVRPSRSTPREPFVICARP